MAIRTMDRDEIEEAEEAREYYRQVDEENGAFDQVVPPSDNSCKEKSEYFKEKCFKKYKGEKITSPVKAIRAKCYNCSGFQWNEVTKCVVYDCSLYPFRFGKNPYRTVREMGEEEKARRAEILKNARKKKLSQ